MTMLTKMISSLLSGQVSDISASVSSTQHQFVYDLVSIIIYVLLTGIIVVAVLRYFAKESKLQWGIYVTLFVTYFVLFSSLALLTIDLAAGFYAKRTIKDDKKNEPAKYLLILWQIVYWTIQLLAWIVVPVCQSYVYTGEFTVFRKLIRSIVENVILYAIMLTVSVLALIGLIIYILSYNSAYPDSPINWNFNMIVGIGKSLSNAYGLLLLISLLGYGIVDFPRYLWRQANMERTLHYYEFQSVKRHDVIYDTEHKMREKLSIVRELDMTIESDHAMRPYVNTIVKTCEKELEALQIGSVDGRSKSKWFHNKDELTRSKLVKLHQSVINAISNHYRSEYQWRYLQDQTFFLEDVIKSINTGDQKRIISPFREGRTGWSAALFDYPEWLYYAHIRKWMFRSMAILFVPFALILVYSQFTPLLVSVMRHPKDISVISLLLRSMAYIRPLVQMVALLLVVLIGLVTLFALFRVEIYTLYRLIPHHSDAGSILYTAVFLCRVVPTLCFNFLQMASVRDTDGVAFYKVMGTLRVDGLRGLFGKVGYLEILGGGFTNCFPVVMIVISAIAFFNVIGYIAGLCNFKRFNYGEELTDADIKEGRSILQRERRKRVHHMNRQYQTEDENSGLVPLSASSSFGERRELDLIESESDTKSSKGSSSFQKLTSLLGKHKKNRGAESNNNNETLSVYDQL